MVEIMSFERLEKLDPYPTGWKSPNLEFFLSLMFNDNTLTKVLIGTWRQKVRFSVTNNSCEGQITWNDIWHCSNLKHRRHHHKITNKFHDILQTWSDRPIWDQFKPMEFNSIHGILWLPGFLALLTNLLLSLDCFVFLFGFQLLPHGQKIVNFQHLVLGFIFVSEFEFVFVVLVFGLL